ncbi:MAG: 8-amino-7-oxononanoate synthase [Deltaproteobacteria bacterium]|nr:8-amino-7-oxononanoate synthase [Deltaproteobacteria bacterium]
MALDFIEEELHGLRERGLYRAIRGIDTPQGPRIEIDGREVINLSSNNYLGLADHPKVKDGAVKALQRYGAGAGASRLVSGDMQPHRKLEARLARFKGSEAALLFNSGYHANLGIITALVGRGDVILSDRLNHASIIDAAILSRATLKRYPHCDVEILERLLMEHRQSRRRLIVTDGLFSMDGDIAPLKEIATLAERYDAILMVDDAHATGALGESGRGSLEHHGITNSNIIQMGTLGKAIGSFGGFVTGSRELIDYLINRARPFVFTTALPPSICAASSAALEIITEEAEMITALQERAAFMRNALKAAGLNTMTSESHIIPLLIGDPERAIAASDRLLKEGLYVQAIRPPTVPKGTSRLRITVMANHTLGDLRYAVKSIKGIVLDHEKGIR